MCLSGYALLIKPLSAYVLSVLYLGSGISPLATRVAAKALEPVISIPDPLSDGLCLYLSRFPTVCGI
jgi:hypothetical protein